MKIRWEHSVCVSLLTPTLTGPFHEQEPPTPAHLPSECLMFYKGRPSLCEGSSGQGEHLLYPIFYKLLRNVHMIISVWNMSSCCDSLPPHSPGAMAVIPLKL